MHLSRLIHQSLSSLSRLLPNIFDKLPRWRTSALSGVVVSYPKSGRTWLRVIFGDLGLSFAFRHAGSSGSKPRPFDPSKHLFKKEIYAKKPVVFLFRDPRDTVVSHYFWESSKRADPYDDSLANFLRDPRFGIEKIVRFNLRGFEQGQNLPKFLPVAYENIVAAPASAIRRILSFVGVTISDSELEKAIEDNTFEKLQRREARGDHLVGTALTMRKNPRRRDPGNADTYKFRRGKIGGYVDYFSADDIAYCDAILASYDYFKKVDEMVESSATPRPRC